jgi:hypothetical protein
MAARCAFREVLQSPTNGSALVGDTVTITKHVVGAGSLGTGEPAEIFLTETESGKLASNKITSDNRGSFTQGEAEGYKPYYLPQGTYDLLFQGGGLKSVYTVRDLVSGEPGAIGPEQLASGVGGVSVKSIIPTEQSRENVAYGTLATPDEVIVLLPENGLIAVAYQASWVESVSEAARAAIFVGANQLKIATPKGPATQAAAIGTGGRLEARPLSTFYAGLVGTLDAATGASSDVTTGQVVAVDTEGASGVREIGGVIFQSWGPGPVGGPCYIFAEAGAYKIRVQFKASSGKVTVKNRKLWAWVVA